MKRDEIIEKMEEGKKVVESSLTTKAEYHHSELRMETSPTAIGFSDSCPCCGSKKRRCLQPASSFRKKILVLESANSDTISTSISPTGSLSLTPPTPPFRNIHHDPISPMSPPPPPTTPSLQPPPPMNPTLQSPPAAAVSPSVAPEETLERSNSTLTEEKGVICTDEEKKVHSKNGEEAAAQEEVRICVRCRCGVVRKIILVR